MWYCKEYNPIQVGSIDGTDIDPHDNAITRATRSNYRPPKYLKTDPNHTLFISRLNFDTTEATLKPFFEKYGPVSNIELIRNNVTGLSQGYAFVTFTDEKSTREAYKYAHETTMDDHIILVDYERSRVMKNWVPRRFGGGFGGKKESGQLRFGARDRPFRDNNGKIHVDYDQRRSDVWKYDDSSKRSSDRHSTRDRRRNSRSQSRDNRRHRSRDSKRTRSRSRDRHSRYENSSSRDHHRSRYDNDRHHSKRRREDDHKDYSRSSHQKSRSHHY